MTESNTAQNHYTLLQVQPTASPQAIRRAYRDLSKLYHPDTTQLPAEVATDKFKALNEAYATLSNPERRLAYDYSIGVSRIAVIQAPSYINRPASERLQYEKNSAYLDPTDRPLSPGELFALFILGVTFVGCLVLVFAIGWTQGELVIRPAQPDVASQQSSYSPEESDLPASEPSFEAGGAPSVTLPQADLPHDSPSSTPEPEEPTVRLPASDLAPKLI